MQFYIRFFNLLAIFSEILPKICLFSENGRYLTTDNWPYARVRARVRALDISANIDPIDLKFSGMFYYVKIKGWTKGIRFFSSVKYALER